MDTEQAVFPSAFVWGCASGAVVARGAGEDSDWKVFENKGVAPVSGRSNYKQDRYDEDFLRLAELGITSYRTSIDWSRIEPQKGVYNREALEDFRRMLEAAKRRGISVWVALHQVALPAWFARLGGFAEETAVQYWHRYVEMVAKELGRNADFWIPMHEPAAYAAGAYLLGAYPPACRRMDRFGDLLVKLCRAQGDAYRILKTYLPSRAMVGTANLIAPVHQCDPASNADRISADFVDSYVNRVVLDAITQGVVRVPGMGALELPSCKGAADFFGIDYFTRLIVGRDAREPHGCLSLLQKIEGMPGICPYGPDEPVSEEGFGYYPEGVYESIKLVQGSGINVPMYITASGFATLDEELRSSYVSACLDRVKNATDQGVDVRGYFHWTDVDGYHFNKGFDLHYGLYGFEPGTGERIERPAAQALKGIAHGATPGSG